MVAFARVSAVETFMLRSKGNSPAETWERISTAPAKARSDSKTFRRKRLRDHSIFFAREISSGRVT